MRKHTILFPIIASLLFTLTGNLTRDTNFHEPVVYERATVTPEVYFAEIEEKAASLSRKQLFDELQTLVWDGWVSHNYDNEVYDIAREVEFESGYLVDMYSNTSQLTINDSVEGGNNYQKEGDRWNMEHLIPKSWWGGGSDGPNSEGGDMFNMYATDGKINGMRSNYPFGEVSSIKSSSNNQYSKLGTSKRTGTSGTVFEPNDEWKGNIARSYFYFALKYVTYTSSSYISGDGATHFNKTGNYGLTDYSTDLFLDWNKHLENNEWEKTRAERVYQVQNNYNPFIYHPEWADYIWGNIPIVTDPYIKMESELNISEGDSVSLNAEIINGAGVIEYTSSNADVASVSTNGTVSGVSKGEAMIEAFATIGGVEYSATCKVVVSEKVVVSGVEISGTNSVLSGEKGKTKVQLTADVVYESGIGSEQVSWTSGNELIAAVDETGLVTCLNNGTVKITARSVEDDSKFAVHEIQIANLEDVKETVIGLDISNHDLTEASYGWKTWESGGVSGKSYIFGGTKDKMQFNNNKTAYFIFNSTPLDGELKEVRIKMNGTAKKWVVRTSDTPFDENMTPVPTSGFASEQVQCGTALTSIIIENPAKYFAICYADKGAAYIDQVELVCGGAKIDNVTAASFVSWINDDSVLQNDCYTKYRSAKEKILAMSEDELNILKTSSEKEYVDARARFEAWCRANGDDNPYGGNIVYLNNVGALSVQFNQNFYLIIPIIVLSVIVFMSFLISRRHRHGR